MSSEIMTVLTERFEMRYFRFGTGKTPLVIIPGVSIRSVMESAAAVKYAYKRFTEDFDVYVFDRITRIPEGYSVYDMAEDTADAFKALGLREACVIGVSQGGMIAQVIAARHPELVKKAVLAATAFASSEMSEKVFDRAALLAESGRIAELNLLFAERIYSPEFFEKYRGVIEDAAGLITPEDAERFLRMTVRMKEFDLRDELDKISCEVLVMCGSEDRIFGAEASRELARRLGCGIEVFEGFGHAFYDETDGFKEKTYGFFTKTE
ncbi:Pimeloyl-ACP methyl ester carboxylesterase [Ruminococcaceae bacterium FB2012]|nr:Pimeloyl-ACP methyl ester carboxylesterase [Ruminococcaceae bacterium FB2012]